MAGKIIVSTLQSDTDNSILFVANTGATIFSANLSNGIAGSFIGNGSVTNAKLAGSITGDKITTGQITGNLLTANCVSGNNIVSGLALTGNVSVTGNVTVGSTIGVGGATAAASGSGITFPATQSASSDANTLDDYEEGTWTPTIGGNATYVVQNGKYTKIGNVVTVTFYMYISSIGTGSASEMSGLPFTSLETTAGTVTYYETLSRAYTFISCYVSNGTTSVNFTGNNATAATTIGFNGATLFQNNARVIGAITYRV